MSAAISIWYAALMAKVGVWTSIASTTFTTENASWAGYTLVQFIPQASLGATGGSQVRLTLQCPSANGFDLSAVYIGQASAGYSVTSPAFAGTPTQILFGGSGTLTKAAGASDVLSDAISFVMPSSNGICISWQCTANPNTFSCTAANLPANWKSSFKTGVSEAATVAKSGYTDQSAARGALLVKLVEELI